MEKFNRYGLQVFAPFPISTSDWNKPMVLFGVDVLVMLISFVLALMFAWPTYMPVPKAMKTLVKTFWTINSIGLELGA